ncbi:hypothetical protein pb186bvf_018990 [Paramecium bursaria]
MLIHLLIFMVQGDTTLINCTSNYQATFCDEPKCCTFAGVCSQQTGDICEYFASDYSCEYANCPYCCYQTGYGTECGTYGYCVASVIIFVSFWVLVTIVSLYLVITRKQQTQRRMQNIMEMAQKAQQEDYQKQQLRRATQPLMNHPVQPPPPPDEEHEHVDAGPQPKSLEDDDQFGEIQPQMNTDQINKQYKEVIL